MLATENFYETSWFPPLKKIRGLGRLLSLQSQIKTFGASSYVECHKRSKDHMQIYGNMAEACNAGNPMP
jgi:hypothetical protein